MCNSWRRHDCPTASVDAKHLMPSLWLVNQNLINQLLSFSRRSRPTSAARHRRLTSFLLFANLERNLLVKFHRGENEFSGLQGDSFIFDAFSLHLLHFGSFIHSQLKSELKQLWRSTAKGSGINLDGRDFSWSVTEKRLFQCENVGYKVERADVSSPRHRHTEEVTSAGRLPLAFSAHMTLTEIRNGMTRTRENNLGVLKRQMRDAAFSLVYLSSLNCKKHTSISVSDEPQMYDFLRKDQ